MAERAKLAFVCHHGKDDEHIHKLRDLLDRNGYPMVNNSVDSTNPNRANNEEYLKRLLRMRIQRSSVVIVLIGPRTHERPWVSWEIDQANQKGKRIVGVFINGAKDSDIPENLDKYGHALVGWDSGNIIGAIEGYHNNWVQTNGEPRPPRDSARRNC